LLNKLKKRLNKIKNKILIHLILRAQSLMKKTCNSMDGSQLETLAKLTTAHMSEFFQRTFLRTLMIFSLDQFFPTMLLKKTLGENQLENSGLTKPLLRQPQEKFLLLIKDLKALNSSHTSRNISIKHGDILMLTE